MKQMPYTLKSVRRGSEDCKLCKIQTTKFKNFQYTLWQMGSSSIALLLYTKVQHYHEAEFWFVYSHSIQEFCCLVIITTSNFHHVCARMAQRIGILSWNFYRDKRTKPFQGKPIKITSEKMEPNLYYTNYSFGGYVMESCKTHKQTFRLHKMEGICGPAPWS